MTKQTSDLRFATTELPTGLRLHYAEQGAPHDPPLILLHGLSDSWFSYSPVLPALAARHHVYVLEQRGHGDSSRPATGYAMTDFAADVVAFMNAVKLPKAVIVGHSMGSIVAIELALAAPERLTGLILVGACANWKTPDNVAFQQQVNALEDPLPPAFVRDFQASNTYAPLPEAFLERVTAESMKVPARVWHAALQGVLAADYFARLGDIRMPTLILGGEHDTFCPPASQRELAKRIPNAELKLYANTRHCPNWEHPEQFVRDVEAFLARLAPR